MIQEAKTSDAEEMMSVINASNRKAYRDIIPPEHFKDPVLTMDSLLGELKRITFYFYVYRQEGRIIGVAALRIEDENFGVFRWVYVHPDEQRHGVGTALVRHIELEAGRRGIRCLRLRAHGKALWAISFYRKLGYGSVERIPRPWGFDMIMQKDIAKGCAGNPS